MKLREILKYLDFGYDCTIWQDIGLNQEKWKEVFIGSIIDIPWYLAEYNLIEAEDNEESEAIALYINDKGQPCFRITLAKGE